MEQITTDATKTLGADDQAKWHVVFGAGQIGWQVAERLSQSGLPVRVVRRSDGLVPNGTQAVRGNALDAAFVLRATQDAAVIYHCMNPSAYDSAVWEEEFPRLGEGLIAAAIASDARLVCLDNVYAYGETEAARTETSPLAATGRKGLVRVRWAERLQQAARENGLRYVAGKAGDFFGPGADEKSALGEERLMALVSNKTLWVLGNADATHAVSYAPDVAKALVVLGTTSEQVEGEVFHLPVVQISPRALAVALAQRLGTAATVRSVPRWVFSLLALFVTFARSVLETFYQWERAFRVDDTKFRSRFPGVASSLDHILEETAATLRAKVEARATSSTAAGQSKSPRRGIARPPSLGTR